METSGLYEVEQLSLFGDQLLFELGSPMEPDSPVNSPSVGCESNLSDLLGIEQLADKPKAVDSSPTEEHSCLPSVQDSPSGLELGWMDRRRDIIDLLLEDSPARQSEEISSLSVKDVPVVNISSANSLWPSTENVLELAVGESTHDNVELQNDLLSEAFQLLEKAGVSVDDVIHFRSFVDGTDAAQGSALVSSEGDVAADLLSNGSEVGQSDSGLDSLPSSCPESPSCIAQSSINYELPELEQPQKKSKRGRRMAPYGKLPADRKERKKIQNKTAALKYRQKKKEESQKVFEEVAVLEEKNKELKSKVESITQEINYLKSLMAEVLKAKLNTV